jgi:hypothetical protein
MTSQINGEASSQAKGQESAAQCEFLASDFRLFQQFIENLKLVTVAEDFQYVVDHLAEVDNLRQEVKVNRREIERLNSKFKLTNLTLNSCTKMSLMHRSRARRKWRKKRMTSGNSLTRFGKI